MMINDRSYWKKQQLNPCQAFPFTTVYRVWMFYLSRGEGHGILGPVPREGQDILIPFVERFILFSSLH